jgi:MFS family permease
MITSLLTMVIPVRPAVTEIASLILLRIADGVGAAMLWPACFALMGDIVEDGERQQAMSYLNLCYLLGIAMAMLIGGTVDDLTGHKWSSLILSSGLFACVAASVYFLIPRREHHVHHDEEPHAALGEYVKSIRRIPGYLLLAFVTFIGIGFPMVVVKLFALKELGLSEAGFGGLFAPAAIGMAALSVPLAKFGDRVGKPSAVHIGMGLCTFGLAFASLGAFLPMLRAAWVLAIGGIPIGIGFVLAIPAWTASVSDIDPRRRGANLGSVMTAQGVGAIVGAPIGGALYEKLQPLLGVHIAHYAPFIGCTVCVAVGWLLSFRLLAQSPSVSALEPVTDVVTKPSTGLEEPIIK